MNLDFGGKNRDLNRRFALTSVHDHWNTQNPASAGIGIWMASKLDPEAA